MLESHARLARCPLCGEQLGRPTFPYSVRWDGSTFTYRACKRCRTAALDPAPTPEQQELIFSYDQYHSVHYAELDEGTTDRSFSAISRYAIGATSLLDFGCGNGAFLRSAALRGYAARGVEYTASAAEMAQSTSGVRVSKLEPLLNEGVEFDVVRLGQVLTAINDPAGLLRTLERLVAPGGFFLIETAAENTPSVAYWAVAGVKRVRRRLRLDEAAKHPPTLVWRAGRGDIERFFEQRLGYQVVHTESFDTGWPLWNLTQDASSPSEYARKTLAHLAVGMSQIGDRLGLPVGNQVLFLLAAGDASSGNQTASASKYSST